MNSYLPLYPQVFLKLSKTVTKLEHFQFTNISVLGNQGGKKNSKGKKIPIQSNTYISNQTKAVQLYPSPKPHQLWRLIDTLLYYIPYTNTRLLTSPDVHQAFFFAQLFTSSGVSFSTSLSFLKTQPLPRGPPFTARLTSNTRLKKTYLDVSLPTGR